MDNTKNTEETKSTNKEEGGNKVQYVWGIKKLTPDIYCDINPTQYKLTRNEYGYTFEQLTPPRYKANVKEEGGQLFIDRDNVYWYDTPTDEEQKEILDYIEDNKILDFMNKQ